MEFYEYTRTVKDSEDDIRLITEFTKAFEDKTKEIKNLKVDVLIEPTDNRPKRYCVPYYDSAFSVFHLLDDSGEIIDEIRLSTEISLENKSNLFKRKYIIQARKCDRDGHLKHYFAMDYDSYEKLLDKIIIYRLNIYLP
jgi:hypothetical protein